MGSGSGHNKKEAYSRIHEKSKMVRLPWGGEILPYRDIAKKRASQKRYREKKKRMGYRLAWVSQTTPHYEPAIRQLKMNVPKRHRKSGYKPMGVRRR
jgi:hypothetical protein